MNTEFCLSLKQRVRTITFNRPLVKNAITPEIYKKLTQTLLEDATNDEVIVTIITGAGDFFSSGNDIKKSLEVGAENLKNVEEMITAFIDYPKLLIAVVNGPSVGIGATICALCDIVYASENAYFLTPFLKMGLCAEGASTWTFPLTLGRSVASEMVFLGKRLTAQKAYQLGFVSEVVPQKDIPNLIEKLHQLGDLPLNNLKRNKRIMMANFKKNLHESNRREMEALNECAESSEFIEAAIKFLNKKSKL